AGEWATKLERGTEQRGGSAWRGHADHAETAVRSDSVELNSTIPASASGRDNPRSAACCCRHPPSHSDTSRRAKGESACPLPPRTRIAGPVRRRRNPPT